MSARRCPWAEPGVGAVATQSFSEKSYGPLGLARMRSGASAPEALEALLAADPGREVRQVGMVDAAGRSAAFTGARCVAAAGHVTGRRPVDPGEHDGTPDRLAGDGRGLPRDRR